MLIKCSLIFISAGHALEHRPQPSQPTTFNLCGMYENLCMIRCRQRWLCTSLGLCPDECSVNNENPHESQVLNRTPLRRVRSSWTSKQAHVGQTKAQAPQPIHRSDCWSQIGLSNLAVVLETTVLRSNTTGTSARNCFLSGTTTGSFIKSMNRVAADLPFSVRISTKNSWSLIFVN